MLARLQRNSIFRQKYAECRFIGRGVRLRAGANEWLDLIGLSAESCYVQFHRDVAGLDQVIARVGSAYLFLTAQNTMQLVTVTTTYTVENMPVPVGFYSVGWAYVPATQALVFRVNGQAVPLLSAAVDAASQFNASEAYSGRYATGDARPATGGFTLFELAQEWPNDLKMLQKMHNGGRGHNALQGRFFSKQQQDVFAIFDERGLDKNRMRWYFRNHWNTTRSISRYAIYKRLGYDASYSDLQRVYFDGPASNDYGEIRNSSGFGYDVGFTFTAMVRMGSDNNPPLADAGYMFRQGVVEWLLQGGSALFYSPATGVFSANGVELVNGIDGLYQFVAVSIGPAECKIYIGNDTYTFPINAAPFYPNAPVTIGSGAGTATIRGYLAHLSYWNAQLTDAQINVLRGNLNGSKQIGEVPASFQSSVVNFSMASCLSYIKGQRSSAGSTVVNAHKGPAMDLFNYVENAPSLPQLLPVRRGTALEPL